MQALQAGTSWAADMFAGYQGARGNQKVGSIQAGNFADLLVLEADPLEDIANTKKIERVMKGGSSSSLDTIPNFLPSRGLPTFPCLFQCRKSVRFSPIRL